MPSRYAQITAINKSQNRNKGSPTQEVARERRKGKFTFAELEDEESNLERLRRYLAQVEVRDTFGAAGRERARAEVERCAGVLKECAQEIYEHQEALGNHRA